MLLGYLWRVLLVFLLNRTLSGLWRVHWTPANSSKLKFTTSTKYSTTGLFHYLNSTDKNYCTVLYASHPIFLTTSLYYMITVRKLESYCTFCVIPLVCSGSTHPSLPKCPNLTPPSSPSLWRKIPTSTPLPPPPVEKCLLPAFYKINPFPLGSINVYT